jgi:hypothetical protein
MSRGQTRCDAGTARKARLGRRLFDDRSRLANDVRMGRLDRRVDAVAEAHPLLYAVAVGLAGGVLALLVGWLARRDWICCCSS